MSRINLPRKLCPGPMARVERALQSGRRTAVLVRCSILAMGTFQTLVALLRLEAQRGDRTRVEPADADRLIGLLAIAVSPIFDPLQSLVDLGNELAFAVAGSELGKPVGFE